MVDSDEAVKPGKEEEHKGDNNLVTVRETGFDVG